MSASVFLPTDLDKDHMKAIATLSDRLHVPVEQVRETYTKELDRLGAHAHIRTFLGVLAFRNTRFILRGGRMRTNHD